MVSRLYSLVITLQGYVLPARQPMSHISNPNPRAWLPEIDFWLVSNTPDFHRTDQECLATP